MGNIGWTGIVIIAIVGCYSFIWKRQNLSSIMGDLAKGIKSFKKGLSDDKYFKK